MPLQKVGFCINILDLVVLEEDTNQDQEQEELGVICYFVGTHTRLKRVTRYVGQ